MAARVGVRAPGSSTAPVDAAWVLRDVERWVANEPLVSLVRCFGGRLPKGPSLEQLEYLDHFSAEHWDFRRGRERDYIEQVELPPSTEEAVFESAQALGLIGSTLPSLDRYDHVLVLGGLVRACLLRPQYAAALHRQGLHSHTITGLTAFRPIGDKEHGLLASVELQMGVSNEAEAMERGLVSAFGLTGRTPESKGSTGETGFGTWLHRSWSTNERAENGSPVVQLVVAPSPEPETRRANSADTYAYWADHIQELTPGDRILLVTSAIYVPFQGCEAVRILGMPRGVSVETIGLDNTGPEHGALRQTFRAAHYLQEVRSTIRSALALHLAAAAFPSVVIGPRAAQGPH